MLDLIEHGNILEELSIKNDDCPGGGTADTLDLGSRF